MKGSLFGYLACCPPGWMSFRLPLLPEARNFSFCHAMYPDSGSAPLQLLEHFTYMCIPSFLEKTIAYPSPANVTCGRLRDCIERPLSRSILIMRGLAVDNTFK